VDVYITGHSSSAGFLLGQNSWLAESAHRCCGTGHKAQGKSNNETSETCKTQIIRFTFIPDLSSRPTSLLAYISMLYALCSML